MARLTYRLFYASRIKKTKILNYDKKWKNSGQCNFWRICPYKLCNRNSLHISHNFGVYQIAYHGWVREPIVNVQMIIRWRLPDGRLSDECVLQFSHDGKGGGRDEGMFTFQSHTRQKPRCRGAFKFHSKRKPSPSEKLVAVKRIDRGSSINLFSDSRLHIRIIIAHIPISQRELKSTNLSHILLREFLNHIIEISTIRYIRVFLAADGGKKYFFLDKEFRRCVDSSFPFRTLWIIFLPTLWRERKSI